MKNATARPVEPNSALTESAHEKGVREEKFSCAKRPLTTRSKRPRQSEVRLPKIESIFEEDWILGFTQGGAFSFGVRHEYRQDKTERVDREDEG